MPAEERIPPQPPLPADAVPRVIHSSYSGITTARRKRSRSRRSKRLEKKIRGLRLVIGLLVLALIAALAGLVSVLGGHDTVLASMAERLRAKEGQISALKARLKQIKGERDTLVKGRIPGLSPIRWGEPIDLKGGMVRKIIFTENRKGNEHSYLYLASLHNRRRKATQPKISILLFNALGIQVGSSRIGENENAEDTEFTLEAGEVRSVSHTITIPQGEKPEYFLIRSR